MYEKDNQKKYSNIYYGHLDHYGHHVFADRYYTTHRFISYLSAKRIYYTGTLTSIGKNFPIEIKNKTWNLSFIVVEKEYYFACGKTKKPKNQVLLYQGIQ